MFYCFTVVEVISILVTELLLQTGVGSKMNKILHCLSIHRVLIEAPLATVKALVLFNRPVTALHISTVILTCSSFKRKAIIKS